MVPRRWDRQDHKWLPFVCYFPLGLLVLLSHIGPSLGQPPYFGFGSASPIGITTTPLAPTDGWKDNFFGKDVVSKFGGLLH